MNTNSKNITYKIAAVLICVAIISYTVFHMVSLFSAELSTVVVGSSTEETKIEFDGYVFRDEFPVYSTYGGAVDYTTADGVKLAAGEQIALVYEQGNHSSIGKNIDMIDAEIEVLERSVGSRETLSELPDINDSMSVSYQNIMKQLANRDIGGISDNIDDMRAQMGKVSLLTDKDTAIEETLEALYEERERIMAAGGKSAPVICDKSGYFYSNIDGYEEIFTLSAAEGLTLDSYYRYTTSDIEPIDAGQNAIGKMVYDSKWYFAAAVPSRAASYFEEGESYNTRFTGEGNINIPLNLVSLTPDKDTSTTLLLFESDRMPIGFSFARAQSVELVVDSVSGINVPKSATHRSDGIFYVYILKGSVVFERRIEIIYEGDDYYTVRDGVEADESDIYLQSNDTLILSGQNLFDGRILD